MSETTIAMVGAPESLPTVPNEGNDPLLVLALQRQVPMDTIERLIALQERKEERSARAEFFAALAKFKATCSILVKDREAKISTRGGSGYDIKYVSLESAVEQITPGLEANDFTITFDCEMPNASTLVTICTLHHVAGHEMKSSFPVPTTSSSAMSDQQRHAAAFTFGRRQSLFAVLGLAASDEGPDKPQDLERISAEQGATIAAVLDELPEARRVAFFRWVGFEHVADIPANRYAEVVAALEKARKS